MTDDLVRRLRELGEPEAADRIERLTEALREIADMPLSKIPSWVRDKARAALGGSSPPVPSGCRKAGICDCDKRYGCAFRIEPAPSAREAAASACVKALEATAGVLTVYGKHWPGLERQVEAALSLARNAGFGTEVE